MKRLILGLALVTAFAAAGPAQAITVQDVMGLARADASDTIIMSKIEADGTVFRLTVDEILELKEAGVSDTVITYMINTGKQANDSGIVPVERPQEDVVTDPGNAGDDGYYGGDYDTGYETGYDSGYDTGYSTGLDSRYRGNVSASFAYYYPHWPGYSWSYYYDPFWWPSLSFYFSYWQPYPYAYWYYDPWYRCNSRTWWYSRPSHYHDYYAYNHHDRTTKRRTVASRGDVRWRSDRIDKGRTPSGRVGGSVTDRRTIKRPSPGIKPVDRNRQVKKPSPSNRRIQPDRPVRRVKPTPRQEIKPTPSRETPRRTVKPTPPPSRNIKPAPSRPAPSRPSPSRSSSSRSSSSRTKKH